MHTPPGWNCGRGRSGRAGPSSRRVVAHGAGSRSPPRKRSPSAHHAPPSAASLEALASRLATDRSRKPLAFVNGSQVASQESDASR